MAMNKTKSLVVLALLLASHIAVSLFYIPVGENLRIYFTYIIVITVAVIYQPTTAVIYALIEDLLAFYLYPTGPFFMGYTLTAVAAMLIYSFFLRQKISLKRIILAKVSVNIFVNILLNSLWSKILYHNAYLYYVANSIIKNTVLLPLEILIIVSFLHLVTPLLFKHGLIAEDKIF